MHCAIRTESARAKVYVAAGVALMIAATRGASAQGCMPLHFTTPSLGGEAIAFLHPGQWEVGARRSPSCDQPLFCGRR